MVCRRQWLPPPLPPHCHPLPPLPPPHPAGVRWHLVDDRPLLRSQQATCICRCHCRSRSHVICCAVLSSEVCCFCLPHNVRCHCLSHNVHCFRLSRGVRPLVEPRTTMTKTNTLINQPQRWWRAEQLRRNTTRTSDEICNGSGGGDGGDEDDSHQGSGINGSREGQTADGTQQSTERIVGTGG